MKQNQDLEEIRRLNEIIFKLNLQLSANVLNERYDTQIESQPGQVAVSPHNDGLLRDQMRLIEDLKKQKLLLTSKNGIFFIKGTLQNSVDMLNDKVRQLEVELYQEQNREDIARLKKDLDDSKKLIKKKEKEKVNLMNVVTELRSQVTAP